jgi:hypothetical protein
MAITAKRITYPLNITGSSQSKLFQSILGKIDQVILDSSTSGQSIDLVIKNHYGEEIFRENDLFLNTSVHDLRPNLIPIGPITVYLENPLNVSGHIDITIIEQERS